jgi:tetratricopeptide (TPR) repeat protein
LPPGRFRSVEVAPDGRHIVTVNGDGSIYVIRPDDAARRLLRSCEALLERDPRCVEALLTRGRIRLAQGRIDEALRDSSAALKIKPGKEAKRLRAAALHQLGLKRADEGKFTEARRHLAEAIRLDPSLAPPPRSDTPPR